MNQQPTTTANFMRDYTIAMTVQMEDKENDGYPTLKVLVIPTTTEVDNKEAIANSRPLIDIYFGADEREGNAEKQRMIFYTPDGSVHLTSNMDERLPPDGAINGALNEAWTGDKESKFMPAVQMAVQRTIGAMMAAHVMSGQSDIPQQELFASLMRSTFSGLLGDEEKTGVAL